MSTRRPSRREFIGLLAGAGTAAAFGAAIPWLTAPAEIGRLLRSELPLPEPFSVPLPIPPVLMPIPGATTDHYMLTQRVATVELIPGVPTEIFGYDGRFPGPTIVSRTGRPITVRHHNRLPVPTVVHLHGGHTPAASDGYPTDLVLPDRAPLPEANHIDPQGNVAHGSFVYAYPMHQRAATLWYHDHRMDFTGAAIWRGLAGFHLVHDDEEAALPLPAGERDVPLMIVDRAFAADGSLLYPALDLSLHHTPGVRSGFTQGVLGDVILINGAAWPFMEVDAVRYRFRVLNASNARRYRVALDPTPPSGQGLIQIGSDGGLLAAPVWHDAIDIAPAERFDLIIDFAEYRIGQTVTLRNRLGSATTRNLMQFRVVRRGHDDARVPPRLADVEPLDPSQAATIRHFTFRNAEDHSWTINGRPFDPGRADANPRLGTIEIWRFNTDFHHPIHLHLVQFQVLDRNGGGPGPYDGGWKDTIDVRPAEQVAVIARFTDYPGRFVFHCHNLEHEDMAMMANMTVG